MRMIRYDRGIVCGELGTYFGIKPFLSFFSSRFPRDVSSSSCVPFGDHKSSFQPLSCRCRSSCSLRKELRVCSQRNCSSSGSTPAAPVGVRPDVDHTLHVYVARQYLESALHKCISGYSQKAGSFDVSVVTRKPMTCNFAKVPSVR